MRGAVAVLNDLGFEVHLVRVAHRREASRSKGPTLKIVREIRPDDDEPQVQD
jgi:hypothetical protein